MTIRLILTTCVASALMAGGCGTTNNKLSSTKDAIGHCMSIPFSKEEPTLSWNKVDIPRDGFKNLPARFKSYHLDSALLDSYFSYSRRPGLRFSFSVPLPDPLGCQYFEVSDAMTIAPGLVEKYPKIVSLKGTAINDRTADIRIDYEGGQMKAQVTWGESVYFVSPAQTSSGTVYIVYQKQDAREEKLPFEQKINPAMMQPAAPLEVR